MNSLAYDGGILPPMDEDEEQIDIDPYDEFALCIDREMTTFAICPFNRHPCTTLCPMAIKVNDDAPDELPAWTCAFARRVDQAEVFGKLLFKEG